MWLDGRRFQRRNLHELVLQLPKGDCWKKIDKKLLACSETLKRAINDLKKPSKVPKRESTDQAAEHELELAACKVKSDAPYAKHAKAIGVHYDLFRQLLADEPQVQ
jgi:hypothetical protein